MHDDSWISSPASPSPRLLYARANVSSLDISAQVPPGTMWVVTDVSVLYHGDGSGPGLQVSTTLSSVIFIFFKVTAGTEESLQWRGWQVLQQADRLGFGFLSGSWDIRASGIQAPDPGFTAS